jgi:Xaa-Pro aminopeptidase
MYGDTLRNPHIRHALPMPMYHPIVYVEDDSGPIVVSHAMEITRLSTLEGIRPVAREEYGYDEFTSNGLTEEEASLEVLVRVCREHTTGDPVVPPDFPYGVAEHLRTHGIEVHSNPELFERRRRAKTPLELAGIRRAQRAAEGAMACIRDALDRCDEELTAERLRSLARAEAGSDGQFLDVMQVLPGAQGAIAHIDGEGPIRPGEPLIVDLGVRDGVTGAWADMTRTFCVGERPADLLRYHELCDEALRRAVRLVQPGVTGQELYFAVCDLFESEDFQTERSKDPGTVITDGFYHGLGHGVGLEIHEPPRLVINGPTLVAGDVIAIEPALYRQGFGGCRLEDLVLVTENGHEVLTDFPYDIMP